MSFVKNDIPILEYDSDPAAVIMPDHEDLRLELPERAAFVFLGDTVDRYAEAHRAAVAAHFISATKEYPVYILEDGGEPVCLVQAPVGAAAAAQILDWLISYDVRKVISAGSCGVLVDLEEDRFLIPVRALRDEGTSYHYLPPSRFVEVSEEARAALAQTLRDHGLPYTEVTAWSTDGFFRETKAKTAYRKEEGCSVVEMECAALAACASLRGAVWGELLISGDTLADTERYDERNWGAASRKYALELCLEAVRKL